MPASIRRLSRAAAAVLAAALLLSQMPALAAPAEPAIPEVIQSNGLPYCIMVNRQENTVTVYTTDDAGAYTVPIRAMVCSTARAGYTTATGTFSISDKYRWHLMEGDVYTQYDSRFNKHTLFHSICFSECYRPDTLITSQYNKLGQDASMGCIRLQTIDAKWIYDNCAAGTVVKIYDSPNPGPLGKPEKVPASIPASPRWDPTDPDPDNPYTYASLSDLRLDRQALTLKTGRPASLTFTTTPETPGDLNVVWASSNPAVATVDALGNVTAVGMGTAVITATSGRIADRCVVTVPNAPLPFLDVGENDWFTDDVIWSCHQGYMKGMGDNLFDPYGSVTQAMALQLLYRTNGGSDTSGESWYSAAQAWAEGAGLLSCFSDGQFHPDQLIFRQELANLFYFYEVHLMGNDQPPTGDLTSYLDGDTVSEDALPAVRWATATGILQGNESGQLLPYADVGRAQFAAIHHRFLELQQAKIAPIDPDTTPIDPEPAPIDPPPAPIDPEPTETLPQPAGNIPMDE